METVYIVWTRHADREWVSAVFAGTVLGRQKAVKYCEDYNKSYEAARDDFSCYISAADYYE